MTLHVRHASASGRLDEGWSFAPSVTRPLVHVLARIANVSIVFDVHVCSRLRPMMGAHPVIRVDGESWRVLAERYIRVWPNGAETLRAIPCPVIPELGNGRNLLLSNTPADVDELLEQLSEV